MSDVTGCHLVKCRFYDNGACADEDEFIDKLDGQPCCRLHQNAILVKQQSSESAQKTAEKICKELYFNGIDKGMPSVDKIMDIAAIIEGRDTAYRKAVDDLVEACKKLSDVAVCHQGGCCCVELITECENMDNTLADVKKAEEE